MNRSTVALTAFAITQAGVLAGLFLTSQQLPDRVASHFNGAGVPDGWMHRSTYLLSMAGIALGLSMLMVGIFYSVRYFPPSMINLPHRDYWLAPLRRKEAFEIIFRAGIWLATLQALLLFGIHLLVVAANSSQPVKLSSHVWFLLVAFVLATISWAYTFIQRFRRAAKQCN